MKHKIVLLTISFLIVFSCEKNEISDNHQKLKLQDNIETINGVLIFKNSTILKQTLNVVLKMSFEEYNSWTRENNFISLQLIYHDIIKAEEIIDEPYESLSELERLNIDPPPEHSELYFKYLDEGLIKEVTDKEDGSIYYELNSSCPSLSPILNQQGIYVVGDTIIQCTSNSVKEWINGDVNNLDKLIKTEKLTEDIKIWILQESGLKSTFNPNPITSGWTYKDSKIRIKLDVYFETWQYLGDGTIWKYKHYVNVKSQKRNWRGKWKYNTTDMFIKGKWDGRIDYEDPEYLYTRWKYFSATYHPSYYPSYYHIIASDFYSSISILYGIIGPYPTTWNILYTVNGERVRILNISIYHLNWEAIGHGDAKATIP